MLTIFFSDDGWRPRNARVYTEKRGVRKAIEGTETVRVMSVIITICTYPEIAPFLEQMKPRLF